MNAPVRVQEPWAEELAREVSTLSGRDFVAFLSALSERLNERSHSGVEKEREVMAALAEHFGDAEEAAHISCLID